MYAHFFPDLAVVVDKYIPIIVMDEQFATDFILIGVCVHILFITIGVCIERIFSRQIIKVNKKKNNLQKKWTQYQL